MLLELEKAEAEKDVKMEGNNISEEKREVQEHGCATRS
jgi:hypothetical protein